MKILICGGGIAGQALAFWLSRSGHDVKASTLISMLGAESSTVVAR